MRAAGDIDDSLRDVEAARIQQESKLLRTLAYEFRVPLPITVGYAEVVVRRFTLAHDQWEITDGANHDRKVWVDDGWQLASDVGLAAAHRYTLDEALATAHQVAAREAAAIEQATTP